MCTYVCKNKHLTEKAHKKAKTFYSNSWLDKALQVLRFNVQTNDNVIQRVVRQSVQWREIKKKKKGTL